MTRNWPDLAVLDLLVGVDEQGSLSAAARKVGMAQPNASRAIKQLERHFGTPLLRRHPRGATLTPHGTVLAHWARRVLAEATQLLDVAESLQTERSATLTVGASMTVAEQLMPRWLGALRGARPEVNIHLQVHNSVRVAELVLEGTCDVGFVESPTVPPGLHTSTVARDRLVVVASPSHPWARRRTPVTIAGLAATRLVVREPGSGTRTTLDRALQEYDRPAPLLELASAAAIRTSVLDGVGPAGMSTLAVAEQVASGALRIIEIEGLDLRRELRAVWRPPRQLSGPAGELVNLARRSEQRADGFTPGG